jgi:hypothetical protein
LETKIRDLAHATQYSKRHQSNQIKISAKRIFVKYEAHSTYKEESNNMSKFIDTLKEKLSALAG